MSEEYKDRLSCTLPLTPQNVSLQANTNSPPVISDLPDESGDGSGRLSFPVVAVGASAGGLEAYVELLAGLPADSGMAFVFIPHLSPDHRSHLVEILSRHTAMDVVQIADGLPCEPNHVYVLPPNARATLSGGRLRLEPRPEGDRIPRPIDHFFRSLAVDQRNHAIGVLLSGADADGSLGLKAIKSEGGITIAQDPDSARFSEMPRSGIMVDHVDLILAPARIGHELAQIARQFSASALLPLEEGQLPQDDEQQFAKVLYMLRSVSGLDFRNYKQTTLRRRLARRMMLKHMDTLVEYLQYLKGRPEELRYLQEDLLINVTRFFRDPEVFDALKSETFPKLFPDKFAGEQIRIWSAGCSTGEETYSLAMTLLEFFAGQPIEPSIQIFGTDASEKSIEKARAGIYPESIAAEISPERLRRYFHKVAHGYQITKRVRDLCVFARQNLCSDPPFSRLSLISCRNVLIYLNAEVQDSIIATFNYALKPNAFLLLGVSESLRNHGDMFTVADRKHKLYLRANNGTHLPLTLSPNAFLLSPHTQLPLAHTFNANEGWNELELQRTTDRIVLARYAPPGVVINERWEILQVRGQVSPYLRVASGTPSLSVLRMVNEGLAPMLRDAVERAMEHGLPVRTGSVGLEDGDRVHEVSIEVLPFQSVATRPNCYLVLFLPSAVHAKQPDSQEIVGGSAPLQEVSRESQREIQQLRQDLASTRAYLQSLIEERDARNQELTSAYEEVQSSNEELQSTNEELETAKEELQSINEELQTVNDELRDRNAALLQASNDLENLFNSVNIPVVILGIDLTIRHFTPPTARMMHLRDSDVGRPIGEIRLNLKLDAIEPLLQEVLDTLGTKEIEVQDRTDRWHILRVRPYRTAENKIDGLVLVLVDVDQIRRGEEAMREARDFAQAVLRGVRMPLAVLGEDLRILKVNAAFCSMTNVAADDLERRSFPELAAMLWDLHDVSAFEEMKGADPNSSASFEHDDARGRTLCFDVRAVKNEGRMLLVTIEDVTSRKEGEKLLKGEQERLRGEVEMTTEALGRTREELSALAAGLFASQEEERRRVARELHDDISQKLALLEVQAVEFRKRLPENLPEIKDQLHTWAERLGNLSEDVRLLSHGLHPSMLDDLGLAPALRQMIREFGEREQMPATFDAVGVVDQLPREAATALYRIAQEALRNVAKHAGKTHVRVILMAIEGAVRLTIKDLGDGFDRGERASSGLGLLSMEERAHLVGGTFRLESEVNAGTTVEVEVPLPNE